MRVTRTLRQKFPFLRYSLLRMAFGGLSVKRTGQMGDGREEALAGYVIANAPAGDVDAAIDAIDNFAYDKSILMNVGDEKGQLLDAAVKRANPKLAMELGAYCGYSGLRIARAAPGATVFSIEKSGANASVARRVWAHAGLTDRVTCINGTVDDGTTLEVSPRTTDSPRAVWISSSSTTGRTRTWTTCSGSSTGAGCIRERSWSPTTSASPAHPSTAPT
jgi:catechol O-methyltransferase